MWYRGYYGSWRDMSFTYLDGTYKRKDIVDRARITAATHNTTVTVMGERGTRMVFFQVCPDGSIIEAGTAYKEV